MAEDDPPTMEVVASGKPLAVVGRFLSTLRKAKGLSQIELAAKAEMDNAQISRMERGENAYMTQYHKYALALGYRNVVHMFQVNPDPELRKLLRIWALLDDEERTDALKLMQDWFDARQG
jgi:transcriptional regulator with XRE-family HTH domain